MISILKVSVKHNGTSRNGSNNSFLWRCKTYEKRFSDIISISKKKSGSTFFVILALLLMFSDAGLGNITYAATEIDGQQAQKSTEHSNWTFQNNNKIPINDKGGKMAWPVPDYYTITETYGLRYNDTDMHIGIDIAGDEIYGAPVIAVADGVVSIVNTEYIPGQGFGIYIL